MVVGFVDHRIYFKQIHRQVDVNYRLNLILLPLQFPRYHPDFDYERFLSPAIPASSRNDSKLGHHSLGGLIFFLKRDRVLEVRIERNKRFFTALLMKSQRQLKTCQGNSLCENAVNCVLDIVFVSKRAETVV